MTKLYYTVFNLVALSLIIYIGVDIFYRTARSRVIDAKTSGVAMQQAPDIEPHKKPPFSDYRIITDRNLFGSHEKASGDIKEEEVEGLEPTSLRVALLGTVSGDKKNARAVIEETDKRKQGLYKVGDSIQDAVVKRILREKVILRVGDKDEILTMKEPSSPQEPPASRRAGRDARRRLSQRTSTRGSTITIRRSDIQESIKDINQLLSQARIQPHYKDGNSDGLAISRIKRGSIFSKLGLRNGDVVQEINGSSLTRPEDILSMYEKLKSGDQASLKITRRGRQKTLNYKFR
jgi:general secretion pathway protein C